MKLGKKTKKVNLVSKHVLRNSEKPDKSGVADQMMVSEDKAEYSEEEVEDNEEGEEYSDEDEKEESDFDDEEGSEDDNSVLAEIGGDESVDNNDEIGGYESDDGIVHSTTRSGRQRPHE
jgi:hypothetical protein